MSLAAPGVSMSVAVVPVSPMAEKVSVRGPAVPAIKRLVNAATPEALVWLTLPVSVPPPALIDAMTATLATAAGFPNMSCNATDDGVAKGERLATVAGGDATNTSFAGGP